MIRDIDIGDPSAREMLIALQVASYAIGADPIGSTAIPPLHDTTERLASSGETFHGYYLEDELVGAVSYKRSGGLLDIHRLVVHPAFFRRGIASELLRYAATRHSNLKCIIVQTGSLNAPACAFYERNGFTRMGEKEAAPRLHVTQFEKRLPLI